MDPFSYNNLLVKTQMQSSNEIIPTPFFFVLKTPPFFFVLKRVVSLAPWHCLHCLKILGSAPALLPFCTQLGGVARHCTWPKVSMAERRLTHPGLMASNPTHTSSLRPHLYVPTAPSLTSPPPLLNFQPL